MAMRKVAIVGAGMTRFMRRAQEMGKELAWQAAKMALGTCELSFLSFWRIIRGW